MDNEEWRQVEGYEGQYLISNQGRLMAESKSFTCKRDRPYSRGRTILKQSTDRGGYIYFTLTRNGVRKFALAHRLVADAFIAGDDPLRNQVNHKDGNKSNNHLSNLEYVSRSENALHAYRKLGRKAKSGQSAPGAKLTSGKVAIIRAMWTSGAFKKKHLSEIFGMSFFAVWAILANRTWVEPGLLPAGRTAPLFNLANG